MTNDRQRRVYLTVGSIVSGSNSRYVFGDNDFESFLRAFDTKCIKILILPFFLTWSFDSFFPPYFTFISISLLCTSKYNMQEVPWEAVESSDCPGSVEAEGCELSFRNWDLPQILYNSSQCSYLLRHHSRSICQFLHIDF